jgi:hypothetical protein
MIHFGSPSKNSIVNSPQVCVAPQFACGVDLVIPPSYLQPGLRGDCWIADGAWTFIDFASPGCKDAAHQEFGFYVAAFNANQAPGTPGFIEVLPKNNPAGVNIGNATLDAFWHTTMLHNPAPAPANATWTYTAWGGNTISISLGDFFGSWEGSGPMTTGIGWIDVMPNAMELFGTWPLAEGYVVNSAGHTGMLNIINRFTGGVEVILDGNSDGTGPSITSWSSGCGAEQLLGNPSFESGAADAWTGNTAVINSTSAVPAHSGAWKASLDGLGSQHTDTISQTVSIPSTCTTASLSFWVRIDTREAAGDQAYDTLAVKIGDDTVSVLSNLDATSGAWVRKTVDLSKYVDQQVTLSFVGSEDLSLATAFHIDDVTVDVN